MRQGGWRSSYASFRSVSLLVFVLALLSAAALATAATVQQGNLRITVLAQLKPYKLPRAAPAPIAVFVAGHLQNPAGGIPPQLQRMTIRVNRHGLLQSRGLPACQVPRIQPGSTERALERCGDALIGSGRFWANIVLPDQGAYPTQGRLLIFNGRQGGRPQILAHIFTNHPFNSSFVIPFSIKRISVGPYGTELKASLPQALGTWGYLDRIKLTLRRKYTYRGRQLSYFNAACPAPGTAKRTSFPLAYASFEFAGRPDMGATVDKTCGVAE
ncbi:MAG TPA: hypothetical protein VIS51_03910 [Solirubrobacterales bacterium]